MGGLTINTDQIYVLLPGEVISAATQTKDIFGLESGTYGFCFESVVTQHCVTNAIENG